ncbi:hypothetical protein TNCV_4748451 [Trichonephila clavipes]|nr:hypothetical protein TNCV_4748451 [Trichonephila clavipes]
MGSRTRGIPPTRWIDDVENDLKTLNIKNWQRVAAYRWNWKKRAVEAAKTCNRTRMMSNKMRNWEKLSAVGELRDLNAWGKKEDLCKTVERALLGKLFYENKENASTAVREIHRRKNLLRGPMSTKGIRAMIKRFEETDGRSTWKRP